MSRPRIGITVDTADKRDQYESPFAYSAAVEHAGGLPLLIPYRIDLSLIPQIVDLCHGFLFSGGNDLDPALYGERYHAKAEPIDPPRQSFEMALLAEVEKRRLPALGICLGSQLMNTYRGGSLHQFLPELERNGPLEHRKLDEPSRRHAVSLDLSTRLGQVIGRGRAEISANTSHKQSVRQLGRNLRVIATAPDGVIEGFEDPSFPLFAAVQWHPERLHEEPEHLAPFQLLVQEAAKLKKT